MPATCQWGPVVGPQNHQRPSLSDVGAHGHSPTGFLFLSTSEGVLVLLHLCMDSPTGVVNWIWFLLCPWLGLGSGLGLTSGWFGWDFRPGPSCIGGVVLGALAGGDHGESLGMGVEGLEESSHSSVAPSTRKRVRPWAMWDHCPTPHPHQTVLVSALVSPH